MGCRRSRVQGELLLVLDQVLLRWSEKGLHDRLHYHLLLDESHDVDVLCESVLSQLIELSVASSTAAVSRQDVAVDEALYSRSAIDGVFCRLKIAVVFTWLDLLAAADASILILAFHFEDIADHVLRELLSCEEPDQGLAK